METTIEIVENIKQNLARGGDWRENNPLNFIKISRK